MRSKKQGLLAMFGRAAKDATPEELEQLTQDAATVLDAEPAGSAQEAGPAKAEPAADEVPPVGDAQGALEAKLDKLIELMTAMCAGKQKTPAEDSPEEKIDKTVAALTGGGKPTDGADKTPADGSARVVEPDEKSNDPAADAAVQMLRNFRPVIAAMKDPAEKRAVADALLASIRGGQTNDTGAALLAAAASTAQHRAADADPEARNRAQQAAYDARNPHRMKKEGN